MSGESHHLFEVVSVPGNSDKVFTTHSNEDYTSCILAAIMNLSLLLIRGFICSIVKPEYEYVHKPFKYVWI